MQEPVVRHPTQEPAVVGHMVIRAPIETVFDYVTRPKTWPDWYPITVAVESKVDRPALPGDEWREEVRLPLWSGYFYWEALGRDRPHAFRYHGYAQKKGFLPKLSSGGRATINYTFAEVGGATLFQRVLEYSSPNRLMVVFDKLMFHNAVIAASNDALLQVKKNLEAKGAGE